MQARVDLHQHALRFLTLPPSAMLPRPLPPSLAQPLVLEQTVQGRAPDDDLLVLGQHLPEMADVEVVIFAALSNQRLDPLHRLRFGPIDRRLPPVAMDYRAHPLAREPLAQPAHLPRPHPQEFARVAHTQCPGLQPGQDLHSSLVPSSQAQCPHTFKYADIFPEQLRRTFSLSSEKAPPRWRHLEGKPIHG